MQSRTIIPLNGSITLHRHVAALIPHLLVRLVPCLIVLALGVAGRNLLLMLAGLALAAGLVAVQIIAWRIFAISVRYDRVRIRYFQFGIRQITYPLPGLRGLTCQQHLAGMLWDTGTLIMTLPDRTLRFTMLTPYSMLNDALGWH